MPFQKPREIAYNVLTDRSRTGQHTEDLLQSRLSHCQLRHPDKALCQELTYGVVRHQRTLDWLISRKTQPRKQAQGVQDALRLGLYQMFWLDRIPNHAAVFETVNLLRLHGLHGLTGFVNAILRRYAAESDQTIQLLEDLKSKDLALAYSHPDWIVNRWIQQYGFENTRSLLKLNNSTPPVFARVNTLKTTATLLTNNWTAERIPFEPVVTDWIPGETCFKLSIHVSLREQESFNSGGYYLQDPTTLLAPYLLNPLPDDSILDYCAAPGGKTSYLAQLTHSKAHIVAVDQDPKRLKLLNENLVRLGISNIQTLDSASFQSQHQGRRFNKVLVDAPCSNSGVLRRRVDARWQLSESQMCNLVSIQSKLVESASNHVLPGGLLVYSTCSLEFEENQQLVTQFLERHSEFELVVQRQLLPFVEGFDGAFVAVLRRG